MAVKCDQCSYEGRNTGTLNDHIKAVHEKVKRYFCDTCDYAAYFKGNLVKHKKSQHGAKSSKNNNAVEYKCNFCTEVTYITMIKVNQFQNR